MAIVLSSILATPNGSYVVRGQARTDMIGDILRASFHAKDDQAEEMRRLLAQLDRQTR